MDLIKIGNLIAGRGERPFAPTEEWQSYLILIPKQCLAAGWRRLELLLDKAVPVPAH